MGEQDATINSVIPLALGIEIGVEIGIEIAQPQGIPHIYVKRQPCSFALEDFGHTELNRTSEMGSTED